MFRNLFLTQSTTLRRCFKKPSNSDGTPRVGVASKNCLEVEEQALVIEKYGVGGRASMDIFIGR